MRTTADYKGINRHKEGMKIWRKEYFRCMGEGDASYKAIEKANSLVSEFKTQF